MNYKFHFLLLIALPSFTASYARSIKVNSFAQYKMEVKSILAGDSVVLANGVWKDVNFIFSVNMTAATINVSTVSGLQSAINNSSAGDIIILADGTYLNNTLNIGTSNITVKSATPGGVFLNGANNINITGNYITFSGFQFASGDIGSANMIEVSGSYNILTQLNINGYYAKKYIQIDPGTQYNEISFCNIENKPASAVIGCTVQINTSPTVPGYHKIRYCSFKNFPGAGGDYGNEPIRIGLSTEMTNISRSVVEYCYFNNVGLGDSESISIKSTENICRYNTFTNNPQGMLVLRHGYRNIAYGNFFINGSGGIRIKEGADHYVYNNYFETGSSDAVTLQYVPEYPLNNINFINNTFVSSGDIDLGGAGLTNINFANNIFKKSSGNIFSNSNGQTYWFGNIYSGSLGISTVAGLINANPLLVINSDGYYGLASSSPAIDASVSGYPAILDIGGIDDDPALLLDVSCQTRPSAVSLKDVGCDEYTTGSITNRPLLLADVGPSYLGGPGGPLTSVDDIDTHKNNLIVYPNPVSGTLNISYSWSEELSMQVVIYNLNGKVERILIEEKNQPAGYYFSSIDLGGLNNGIYLLKLISKKHTETRKIIIAH